MSDLDVQNAGDSFPPSLSEIGRASCRDRVLISGLSNSGPGDSPASVTGVYRSTESTIATSEALIGTHSDASLSAVTGRSDTFTIDTTGWAAGTYYICAVAYYANSSPEANETNIPSSVVLLTVTAPTHLPDLDVQNAGDSFPPSLS